MSYCGYFVVNLDNSNNLQIYLYLFPFHFLLFNEFAELIIFVKNISLNV